MERTGSEHTKIGQMRMAELVAAALRDRILAGGIGDGSTLPKQDELVAEFGVSYPSVREALRILETEGFITVRRGNRGGATVHAPDIGTAGYALGLTLQAMQVGVPERTASARWCRGCGSCSPRARTASMTVRRSPGPLASSTTSSSGSTPTRPCASS
jgi:DNA-binding transcriptional MocR family regulator